MQKLSGEFNNHIRDSMDAKRILKVSENLATVMEDSVDENALRRATDTIRSLVPQEDVRSAADGLRSLSSKFRAWESASASLAVAETPVKTECAPAIELIPDSRSPESTVRAALHRLLDSKLVDHAKENWPGLIWQLLIIVAAGLILVRLGA